MSLGSRIRARRRQLELTLQEVAQRTGLSKPFLSQVERDLSSPSLTSLVGIAKALGVSTEFFISVPDEQKIVSLAKSRQTFKLEPSANSYARLTGAIAQGKLESLLVHIPAHSQFQEITVHAGEELLYVLQGYLHLEVADKIYELSAGDSAHYLSTDKHLWGNKKEQECIVLWVGTPKLF